MSHIRGMVWEETGGKFRIREVVHMADSVLMYSKTHALNHENK